MLVEPEERLARDRVRRAAAEELTTLVLEELVPTVHRLRLETASRLGLTAADLTHLQRVPVALVPHEERDRHDALLRFHVCAALTGAPGLDRPRVLVDLVGFLTTLGTCLHRVATGAATSRWARRQHAERQRRLSPGERAET